MTNLPEAEEAMRRLVNDGYRVVIAFEQRAEAERAGYVLRRTSGTLVHGGEVEAGPGVSFLPLPLRRHFLIPDLKLALLTDAQVFPRRHKAAPARRPTPGVSLSSFRDLRKGDFVVHEDHGVGRFEGISTKTVAGVTRDYLDLAYKDRDMLYVPHDQIGKVMRYVGAGGAAPSLSKLGGKAWEHIKSRVRRAARQVAGELLHLYALRQATKGFRFSEDGEWQVRFEKAFPYEETEDQLRAIDAVKDDMESDQPHGPAALRRRGLRQDRGGAAGGLQGHARQQAGDGAGADHHPGPAALRHLPGALRRLPRQGGDDLPLPVGGRAEEDPQGLRRRQGGRAHRHAPAALATTSSPRTWAW